MNIEQKLFGAGEPSTLVEFAGKRIAIGAYTDHRVNLEVPNDFHHVVKP